MTKLPDSYQPASWRCVTAIEPGRSVIGLAFDLSSGGVIRLALDIEDSRQFALAICESLSAIRISLEDDQQSIACPNQANQFDTCIRRQQQLEAKGSSRS